MPVLPNSTDIVIFHHDDDDGLQAGYYAKKIVNYLYPAARATFHEINYPEKFPYDLIPDGSICYFVDTSFSKNTIDQLKKICSIASKVTLIDHHASTVDIKRDIKPIKNLTVCVSSVGSGSLLTYCYYKIITELIKSIPLSEIMKKSFLEFAFDDAEEVSNEREIFASTYEFPIDVDYSINGKELLAINVKIPKDVLLVDDYDRWVKGNPDTDFFELGLGYAQDVAGSHSNKNPADSVSCWNDIDRGIDPAKSNICIDEYINAGRIIKRYLDNRYAKELEEDSYVCNIKGIKTLVINSHGNSWVFGDAIKKYPMVCMWNFCGKDGRYIYSFYSDNDTGADCQKVAEAFGGGGHPHASGCQSHEFLFKPEK